MGICEYQINPNNKCHGCIYLELKDNKDLLGKCVCQTNKIKNRQRYILDKKCQYKQTYILTPELLDKAIEHIQRL